MQSNKGNGVLEDFPGRFLLSLEQEVCKVAVFCHCENTNDKERIRDVALFMMGKLSKLL